MADFNVKVQSGGDSSGFIGASRGVAAPQAQQFATDNSKATKTQGLANDVAMGASLFQTGVKFADDAIKDTINTQARNQMDQIYNEFGVGDVALQGQDVNNEPLPSEIATAEKSLNRLSQARQRGTVNENSYWARVESLSRQLRAKYPGHRDYIDQRVSSIAGGDPANSIVRNLQEEAAKQASQANAMENKKLSLVEDLAKKGVLLNGWEKMSFPDMVNNHAPLLRSIAKTEQDKAQIELAKSRNEATNILVGKSVNEYVGRQLDMATSNLINPNNENFANMVNLIEKGNRSGSLSPDEQGQVRVAMNQYRTKVTEEVMAGLRREYGGDLTGKMMEDAKQTITDHMSIYENALTNKDYGLLNYTIHALEDQKTNDSLSLTKSPFIRLNAALTGLLGPQASEMVMQWGSGLAQGRDKALFANELTGLLTGKDGKSLFNTISASKDNVGDVGKFTEAMVNAHVAVLNNQATTPEALKNAAKSLYGEENAPFLRSIKSDKQEMVFNRLVNNTVFQRMKQARDNGDAETYNNYVGWTKNAFPVLFRKAADTLSKTTRQQEISVQFSTETNQFKVMSPDPNSPALNGISRGLYGESYTVVSRAVDRMNSSIRGILPILKEEGTEPMSFLGNAFQNLGMDTEGNLLGQARSQLMKGSVMKLGGAEFTPEEMAIQLPPGKELQMKDPTSGQMVSRFRPGDSATIILPRTDIGLGEAPINVRQMTSEQGDAVQLDELNSMATRKKQDLLLLQQMAKENPEDTGIRDQLDKVITDYTDLVKEIHIINNAWVEQFSKKK